MLASASEALLLCVHCLRPPRATTCHKDSFMSSPEVAPRLQQPGRLGRGAHGTGVAPASSHAIESSTDFPGRRWRVSFSGCVWHRARHPLLGPGVAPQDWPCPVAEAPVVPLGGSFRISLAFHWHGWMWGEGCGKGRGTQGTELSPRPRVPACFSQPLIASGGAGRGV